MNSNTHYKSLNYRIEKQITVEDNSDINELSKQGFYLYIIYNTIHKYRFAMLSTNYYPINKQFLGSQLNFYNISKLSSSVEVKIISDAITGNFLEIIKTPKKNISNQANLELEDKINSELKISQENIRITPQKYFMKHKKTEKGSWYDNLYKISTARIVTEKNRWFLPFMYKNSNKIKTILKKTLYPNIELDNRIEKALISELYKMPSNEFMHCNTHMIILTQGKTGKSSILGMQGKNLDNTSNAGLYGYYNTNHGWNAGIVEQTDNTILIDEINEIINTQKTSYDNIMNTINKPLENGMYYYGKAGGKAVTFKNQFIFMGNISSDFNFENFINGIATNVETIGRRFAYIIYDDKAKFKINYSKPYSNKNTENIIDTISEGLSFKLKEILLELKFQENYFYSKKCQNIIKDWTSKIFKIINRIEVPNTKKFMISYITGSLDNRLKMLALELTIFKMSHVFFALTYKKTNRSLIIDDFYKQLDLLCQDIHISFKNIADHLENSIIEHLNIAERDFKALDKTYQMVFEKICLNEQKFIQNRLYYTNINNKERLKYFIRDLKLRSNLASVNNKLNGIGLGIYYDANLKDYFFSIIRKPTYDKYKEIILKELEHEIEFNDIEN